MDTTSTALASVLFYLCNFTDVKARLTAEIRSSFSGTEEIRDGLKLRGCKFLAACINESLRMSPPAGGPLCKFIRSLSFLFINTSNLS
jgi:cytochrome P450